MTFLQTALTNCTYELNSRDDYTGGGRKKDDPEAVPNGCCAEGSGGTARLAVSRSRDEVDMPTNPKIVEKIPLFQKLSFNQIQQVLHLGQMKTYKEGNLLCKDRDKSNAMFILLAGELAVKDGDIELARVKPVEIVGEMGLISGEPRCATIQVAKECTVIYIGKMQFDVLLRTDVDMASKIYKNVVDSLCQKLRENNTYLSRVLATAGSAAETTTT